MRIPYGLKVRRATVTIVPVLPIPVTMATAAGGEPLFGCWTTARCSNYRNPPQPVTHAAVRDLSHRPDTKVRSGFKYPLLTRIDILLSYCLSSHFTLLQCMQQNVFSF